MGLPSRPSFAVNLKPPHINHLGHTSAPTVYLFGTLANAKPRVMSPVQRSLASPVASRRRRRWERTLVLENDPEVPQPMGSDRKLEAEVARRELVKELAVTSFQA